MKIKKMRESNSVPAGVKIISAMMAVYGFATIFRSFAFLNSPEPINPAGVSILSMILVLSILILSGSILMSQKKKKGLYIVLFYFGMFVTQKIIQITFTLAGHGDLIMATQERAQSILMPAIVGMLFHLTLFFYLSSEKVMKVFAVSRRVKAIRNIVLSASGISLLLLIVRIAVRGVQ